MKKEELRIGNLIRIRSLTDGYIETVETNLFHLNEINKTVKYEYLPIKINKTYLDILGFKEFYYKGIKGYINGTFEILYNLNSKQAFMYNEVDGSIFNIGLCKNVHKLQNIYFALTGKELEYDTEL